MRNVTDIKKRHPTKDPNIKVTPVKTLESRRNEIDTKDPVNQRSLELNQENQRLGVEVKEKTRELANIRQQLESTKAQLESGIDKAMNEAKQAARSIIEEAQGKRKEVAQLEANVNKLRTFVDIRVKDVNIKEELLTKDRGEISKWHKDIGESQVLLQEIADGTNDRHQYILDSLYLLSSLVDIATCRIEDILSVEDEFMGSFGQLLGSFDAVYNDIIKRELSIKLDRDVVAERKTDLDLREAQIADSRKALNMAQKELNHG